MYLFTYRVDSRLRLPHLCLVTSAIGRLSTEKYFHPTSSPVFSPQTSDLHLSHRQHNPFHCLGKRQNKALLSDSDVLKHSPQDSVFSLGQGK